MRTGWLDMMEVLSLDVVAGALAGGVMATRVLHVHPGWAWWVCLAIAVWVFYTTDHLLDGIKGGKNNVSKRHQFHFEYQKQITAGLVFLLIVVSVLAVYCLSSKILLFGGLMALLSFFYLLMVWQLRKGDSRLAIKEAGIALIYTAGVWGVPLIYGQATPSIAVVVLLFAMLVFMEGTIAALYEVEWDKAEKHVSLPLRLGVRKTSGLLNAFFSGVGIVTIAGIIVTPMPINAAFAILALMNVLLFIIFKRQTFFSYKSKYHHAGELLFILPAGMLII